MSKKQTYQRLEHSPTLNTILMVEDTLKNMNESEIKISQLKRILPRKVNHYILKRILEYLESSGKIFVSLKGIVWLVNNSPKLAEEIRKGYDYNEGILTKRK